MAFRMSAVRGKAEVLAYPSGLPVLAISRHRGRYPKAYGTVSRNQAFSLKWVSPSLTYGEVVA